MNIIQRIVDGRRHRGEYPAQRARRRWLHVLAQGEPVQQARPVQARVDIVCRCGHTRTEHVVYSAGQAACTEACACIIFRADRVRVS
jgi:hypothetical protein